MRQDRSAPQGLPLRQPRRNRWASQITLTYSATSDKNGRLYRPTVVVIERFTPKPAANDQLLTSLEQCEQIAAGRMGHSNACAAKLLNYGVGVEPKALTYTSWARPGIRSDEVDAIISSARINNPLDGITGVLIFNGAAFLQILEGGQSAVDDLARRLASDPRHSNMSIRDERLISARTFPDMSMAYLRLEDGKFDGETAVKRALERDLPSPLRNIVLGMVSTIVRASPPT